MPLLDIEIKKLNFSAAKTALLNQILLLKLMEPLHGISQVCDAEETDIQLFIALFHSAVDHLCAETGSPPNGVPGISAHYTSLLIAVGFGLNDEFHALVHRLLHDSINFWALSIKK